MITDFAKSRVALLLGNSGASTAIGSCIPTYFIIGSGSGTVVSTQTTLFNAVDRQIFTSTDLTTTQKITWTGDWNTVEMSGIQLREFGVLPSGGALTGSIWSKTGLPSITFDGTNELKIQETWEVY